MRLSSEALLEIVVIFQNAVLEHKDASQQLRELDFVNYDEEGLMLSPEYKQKYPRATVWPEQEQEEV